ncbi:MAG: hypothetical protein LBF93_13100 [Zoogloeaceae bacterium]|nr:hypothetical protein [Zoogloeaceae bacterium]
MDNQTLHEIERSFTNDLQSAYHCLVQNPNHELFDCIQYMAEAFTELALEIHRENNIKAFAPPAV